MAEKSLLFCNAFFHVFLNTWINKDSYISIVETTRIKQQVNKTSKHILADNVH